MTLLLTAADLSGLVDMTEAIQAMREAHAELAEGKAVQPPPTSLSSPISGSVLVPMVASSSRLKLSVVKVLTDAPQNRERGLPAQRSTVTIVDSTTGECVAIIDGAVLTRERTAATTAMATDVLANPDSSSLGLVGAGPLAVEHVKAIRAIRPIRRVHIWSRSAQTLETFRSSIGGEIEIRNEPTPRDVVVSSEIVCTLTPSRMPIVSGAWFQPGLHINAVGAPPRGDHREIDGRGMAVADVFVDSTTTQLAKSGDALLSIAEGLTTESHFAREIGMVIIGKDPGRTNRDQITMFNSVGIALQDLAYAAICIDRAKRNKIGQEIHFGPVANVAATLTAAV